MNSPEGMRFVSRLVDHCGVFASSFNPDISVMSFNEGRRSVGLMIMSLLEECPDGNMKLTSAAKYRAQLYDEDEKEYENEETNVITGRPRNRRR